MALTASLLVAQDLSPLPRSLPVPATTLSTSALGLAAVKSMAVLATTLSTSRRQSPGTLVALGAGNDSLSFANVVSSNSISGGAGSDQHQLCQGLTTAAAQNSGTVYYYSGGTDTLNFAVGVTSAAGGDFLTVKIERVSVSIATLASGSNTIVTGTKSGTTTNLVYVNGVTNTAVSVSIQTLLNSPPLPFHRLIFQML